MGEKRRFFSAEEKVKILREHFLDKKPLSDICDQHKIKPTLFYRWQKQLFERGHVVFREEDDSRKRFLENKISSLEQRLNRKNEVVSELLEENIQLKKNLGEI